MGLKEEQAQLVNTEALSHKTKKPRESSEREKSAKEKEHSFASIKS